MPQAELIYHLLEDEYPQAGPELHFANDYQLFVAVVLSAQTTDMRVNQVTPKLFASYPGFHALAEAEYNDLYSAIVRLGLAKAKADNLIKAAQQIVNKYGGDLPSSKSLLMSLPGVGIKTANVILSVAFGHPAIAVDTHVFRVANRIGLIDTKSYAVAQKQIEVAIPTFCWSKMHHLLIWHGRRRCTARNPNCIQCVLVNYCKYFHEK